MAVGDQRRFPELDQLGPEDIRVLDYPPPPPTEEEIQRGRAYRSAPFGGDQ